MLQSYWSEAEVVSPAASLERLITSFTCYNDIMILTKTVEIPFVGVSHNEDIKKQVIIDKGVIPQLMTFGKATFKPGQEVEMHKHDTMYEVFYVLSGKALFIVNNEEIELTPEMCLTIEQGELHSQKNPFTEDVTWLYFGIATD
jgi:quercetin dioxygenase-like cupin family protein